MIRSNRNIFNGAYQIGYRNLDKLRVKEYVPHLIYAAVSLIIIRELLPPGYIFTLDMGFPIDANPIRVLTGLETGNINGILVTSIFYSLKKSAFFEISQRFLIFLTFFLAGLCAYQLCPSENIFGKIFAGLLYILNPFTFVRYVVGHWLFLFAYAITPLFVKQSIAFFEIDKKTLAEASKTALLLALIGIFSEHMFVMALLLFCLILAFYLFRKRKRDIIVNVSFAIFIILLGFLTSTYWITLEFLGVGILSQIGEQDLAVFRSTSWGVGVDLIFALVTLHGFWRQPEGYHYISEIIPSWYLFYFVLLFLTIYGFLTHYDEKKIGYFVKSITLVGILSFLLAIGNAPYPSAAVFNYLYNNVFFFKGFREPQKFLALLALTYSILGGLGLGKIASGLKSPLIRRVVVTLILAILLAYSSNMLIPEVGGQPMLSQFPIEWQEADLYLQNRSADLKVLFLPWHAYMRFTWLDRIIVNPANFYYTGLIIQSKNIEVGPITHRAEPAQAYIQFILDHREQVKNLGTLLVPLGIQYIILAKEADYRLYDFLYRQSDLTVIFVNSRLAIFENICNVTKLYWVKNITETKNWSDLFSTANYPSRYPLHYTELSPVEYIVDVPYEKGYVVFTEQYDTHWTLDGNKPLPYLNVSNAFYVEKAGRYRLHFQKFDTILFSYLISFTSFLLTVVCLIETKYIKPSKLKKDQITTNNRGNHFCTDGKA